jgi:hypothetical protein
MAAGAAQHDHAQAVVADRGVCAANASIIRLRC